MKKIVRAVFVPPKIKKPRTWPLGWVIDYFFPIIVVNQDPNAGSFIAYDERGNIVSKSWDGVEWHKMS